MLDRHAVQQLLLAKVPAREIAQQVHTSVRTVRRIAREAKIEAVNDATARATHPVGRPAIALETQTRVKALLEEDPERPPW
jgi:hypothetical protein